MERLTIQQLVERLQQLPQDLPVVVHGYENGYDPVTDVDVVAVSLRPDRHWYDGVFKDSVEQGDEVALISSMYNRYDPQDPNSPGPDSRKY
jgi:hypothetical protein